MASLIQIANIKGPKGDKGDGGTPAWAAVTGKPATFPPEAHTHGRLDNPQGYVVLDAQGGLQHGAAGARVWSVNNLGVLTAGAVPAERITGDLPTSRVVPIELTTENLDEVTTPGTYFQVNNSRATLERNYPIAGMSGVLENLPVIPWINRHMQRFTPNHTLAENVYIRAKGGDGWSAWSPYLTQAASDKRYALAGAVPADAAEHDYRLGQLRARRGNVTVSTPAVVVLAFDHGLTKYKSIVHPLLTARGLPVTLAVNSQLLTDAVNSGATAADLQAWAAGSLVEVANHGRRHTYSGDLVAEIRGGREELEAIIGQPVDTYMNAGVTGDTWGGFDDVTKTARGRIAYESHAIVSTVMPQGNLLYPIGEPTPGARGSWIEDGGAAITAAKAKIGEAVTAQAMTIIRLHPEHIDGTGRITTAELSAFLDWLVAERNAGRITVMQLRDASIASRDASLAEVKDPTVRFDQFPLALTNTTTLNSAPMDGVPIVRGGNYVYAAFFGADMNPYIARRRTTETTWEVKNLAALTGNPMSAPAPRDAHNNLSIGVDNAGYVHVSGNHHAVPLNYIRSVQPYEIDGWETPGMVGTDEANVTYPVFATTHTGELLFFYRSGWSSDGDLLLNKYSTTTRKWSRVGMVLKGHGWVSTPSHPYTHMSAYPARIAIDRSSGRIHLWWVWRGTTDVSSNHDLHYAYSVDGGVSWRDAAGATLAAPITGATESTLVFSGGSGHVAFGACVDSAGIPHVMVRMRGAVNETRHYWRSGTTFSYEVVGSDAVGKAALFAPASGGVFAVYNESGVAKLRQIAPTLGAPITLMPWQMGSWAPSVDVSAQAENTLRVLVAPVTEKTGSSYGGVLTMPLTSAALAGLASGNLAPARPLQSPVPLEVEPRGVLASYELQAGLYYGPSGTRGNSPALANGVFRGHLITASRSGVVVEAVPNITTAGAAGAKGRVVAYGLDGKVLAQSVDFDATVTGTRPVAIDLRLAKGQTVVIGVLNHSSSGAGAIYSALFSTHDARMPLTTAGSYFSAPRSGFELTGVAVPAVDRVSFAGVAATTDNSPAVVVKAGVLNEDWSGA